METHNIQRHFFFETEDGLVKIIIASDIITSQLILDGALKDFYDYAKKFSKEYARLTKIEQNEKLTKIVS